MIDNFFGITWAALNNSVWLPLFIALCGLVIWRYIQRKKVIKRLAGNQIGLLMNNGASVKQILKVICMIVGIIFLFLALLRPQWDKSEETIMQEGRDLYIALDISRSMLACDCMPNRLVCAKEKIKRLLKKLSCDRVGLILFSGSAFVHCPLTADYSAFFMYLDAVDAELISSGTTALDQAIQQALTSFASMSERKNKLLAVFTDGEDFSHNLTGIKQKAIDEQMSIFTVGIGTVEGAPVPLYDKEGRQAGHQKDAKGAVVISRLNETMLRPLSEDAGGRYMRIADDDADINTLVAAVYSFEKEELGEKKLSRAHDQYHYFLLVSFVCFILEWLL